ncbi:MAG: ATP-dependent sacrificial sulfur transferase LarE [Endomicrobiales bacterium]|nr:ATP-dependent sacrificial sulfur transferase LarE [Endomicrobiales bacterium]
MNNKFRKLRKILKKLKRVMVAFSGGVDSTFLLQAAVKTLGPENVLAATAIGGLYFKDEIKRSKGFAKKLNIRHLIIKSDALKNKDVKKNTLSRCFYCKNLVFKKLHKVAKKENAVLCDATNFSDLNDFRPGLKALKKWRVTSPLKDAKLEKNEIRKLCRKQKIPIWNLPAQACLATRIPYGTRLDKKELQKVEKGEMYLRKLGFELVRLRNYKNTVRIETSKSKIKRLFDKKISAKVTSYLKKLGWGHVTFDLEGYRTGGMQRSSV